MALTGILVCIIHYVQSQGTYSVVKIGANCFLYSIIRNGTYYVQSNQIISELPCHRNLSTSSKTVPLCLKQILVVRTSIIQISDTRTSFLTILRFLCVIFFIICHDFNPSVWHTQGMTNFVTIFHGDFSLPCGIALSLHSREYVAITLYYIFPIIFLLLVYLHNF